MRQLIPIILLLTSCSHTSRSYVHKSVGYSVTRGEILGIENLLSGKQEPLLDGLALLVQGNGCRVIMRVDSRTGIFELGPSSEIVLARGGDYILLPYGEEMTTSNRRLLELANLAIDFIEMGSVEEAGQVIDRIEELFPGDSSAKQFQTFLRGRLPTSTREPRKLGNPAASGKIDPDAARKAYKTGQKLLKVNRNSAALNAFEEAHSLDPDNLEITDTLVFLLKNTGIELYSKGKWDEAIFYWEKLLKIRPGDVEGLTFLRRARALETEL